MGTMHRDHHSIGRTIVAATLKEAGYRVNDLGVDVRPSDFLERVEETGAPRPAPLRAYGRCWTRTGSRAS